jgi:hypothetical protein
MNVFVVPALTAISSPTQERLGLDSFEVIIGSLSTTLRKQKGRFVSLVILLPLSEGARAR